MDSKRELTADDLTGTRYDFADTSMMRGAWLVLLVGAARADESNNYAEKISFCGLLRDLHSRFFCGDCKEHFGEFLEANQPEMVIFVKDGLFGWIVKLMNSIDRRIGKPERDYHVLYMMFHGKGIAPCQTRCSSHGKQNTAPPGKTGATFTINRPR